MEHDKTCVMAVYVFHYYVNDLDISVPFNFVSNIANQFIVGSLDLLQRDGCKKFRSTSNVILDMKLGGT